MATQAITFRTFFEGLANSFPQMSQTVYNAMLYKQNQSQMDRMYELESVRTEADVAESKAATALTEAEMRDLLPLQVEAMKLEIDEKKLATDLQKIDIANAPGEKQRKIEKHLAELGEINARTLLLTTETYGAAANTKKAELDASIAQMQYNTSMMNVTTFLEDPANLEKAQEVFANTPKSPNGLVDGPKFFENLAAAGIKTMSPEVYKSVLTLRDNLTMYELDRVRTVDTLKRELYGKVLEANLEKNKGVLDQDELQKSYSAVDGYCDLIGSGQSSFESVVKQQTDLMAKVFPGSMPPDVPYPEPVNDGVDDDSAPTASRPPRYPGLSRLGGDVGRSAVQYNPIAGYGYMLDGVDSILNSIYNTSAPDLRSYNPQPVRLNRTKQQTSGNRFFNGPSR